MRKIGFLKALSLFDKSPFKDFCEQIIGITSQAGYDLDNQKAIPKLETYFTIREYLEFIFNDRGFFVPDDFLNDSFHLKKVTFVDPADFQPEFLVTLSDRQYFSCWLLGDQELMIS